ncbi:unnamed protein product [Brachionus calyciflorus]|uniref:glutathione transferase n=1 Tax=Brachionus calyciflorus TaxID=104777 RepID=A0A814ARK0_9BILA|nr:unnamed protein product [Brachionus calyciflorus]
MVKYKLYYFNVKGRAELIRLIFALSGQDFEDVRFQMDQWSEYKKNTPLGQVPYLEMVEDNGKVFKLGQTLSIARYLSRKFKLTGTDLEEQALVESYGDLIYDLQNEIVRPRFEQDETKKSQMLKKLFDETIPKYFQVLENLISNNSCGYLASCGLTWPDLFLFTVIDNWLAEKKDSLLANYPHIKTLEEKVRNNAKISEWCSKRPKTDY